MNLETTMGGVGVAGQLESPFLESGPMPEAEGPFAFGGGPAWVTITGTRQGKLTGDGPQSVQGRIRAQGVTWGVASARDTASGQALGRRQYQPLVFTHEYLSPSTPQLLQALASNEVLEPVQIEFMGTSPSRGTVEVRQTIDLKAANVTSLRLVPNPVGQGLLQEVALVFRRITVTNMVPKTSATDDWGANREAGAEGEDFSEALYGEAPYAEGPYAAEVGQAWSEEVPERESMGGETTVLHRCRPGEGPPAPIPDPEGKGLHPLVLRSSSARYSRNPTVGHAQRLLNRFLTETMTGYATCIDQTPQRLAFIQHLRAQLRRNGQDPLIVDCRFGPNTEMATKIFQACRGVVRDGKIGPVTWRHLQPYEKGLVPGGQNPNPPDHACSGPDALTPDSAVEHEHEFEQPELLLEHERRAAVRPRLSFFANDTHSAVRNHFQCGASVQAARMAAYANPNPSACTPRSIGATPYDTGADVINAIAAARQCLDQRIDRIHIFSHSGNYGIFGTTLGATQGLYINTDADSRSNGARVVTDIPASHLADDVVIVLHGCNTAEGSDSIAQRIYEHLAATLHNPRVFGHYNTGCASRDNSWREFSKRVPNGQFLRTIAPHYSDAGCCGTPTPRRSESVESLQEVAQPSCACGAAV